MTDGRTFNNQSQLRVAQELAIVTIVDVKFLKAKQAGLAWQLSLYIVFTLYSFFSCENFLSTAEFEGNKSNNWYDILLEMKKGREGQSEVRARNQRRHS